MNRYVGLENPFLPESGEVSIVNATLIGKVLRGSKEMDVRANKPIENVYQLGWSSALVFNAEAGSYFLKKLYKGSEKNLIEHKIETNDRFQSIVTRGVDSCTFVYITKGTQLFMGHFDSDYLTAGLDIIEKVMGKEGLEIYCSAIDQKDEKDFIKKLKNFGMLHFYDRGDFNSWYSPHFEIGVELRDGASVLYGDKIFINLEKQENKAIVFTGNENFSFDPFSALKSSSSSATPTSSSATPSSSSATPSSVKPS